MERDSRQPSLLVDSWCAHTLRFERPLAPKYEDAIGLRILVAFLMVGIGAFFALRLVSDVAGVRGFPATNMAFVVALVGAFFLAQRAFVGLPIASIGLRIFADWTSRERL